MRRENASMLALFELQDGMRFHTRREEAQSAEGVSGGSGTGS